MTHQKIINKIKNVSENKIFLPNCVYEEIDFNTIIQKKINNILIQRLDEYLTQILVAESIKNKNDVLGIITLNFSGETEKIFSRIKNDIPVILLQHAFANYTKSISYFDMFKKSNILFIKCCGLKAISSVEVIKIFSLGKRSNQI